MAGPLDSLVTVTILTANASPQLANFGTPAFVAYHTHNTDAIRTYSSLAGMVTDGFLTTEPAYYWATTVLSQSPSVPTFKIIRGTSSVIQTGDYTVTDSAVGDTIGFSVVGVNGVVTAITTTSTGVINTDAATLAAITPANGTSMTNPSGAIVRVLNTVSSKVYYIQAVKGGTWEDKTPTASPATDLNSAIAVDTAFYGVTDEHQDATNILATAVWAEANKRMHVYTTADSKALLSAQGIGNTLKSAGYTYSFGQWGGTPVQYGASGLESQRFTAKPGTDSWAYKQLAGVTGDALTATQITNANGNNLNYYLLSVANVNITLTGINASGLYADLRRGIDALANQIQIQVYQLLLNQPKVAYDPNGIAMVGAEVSSALAQYTASANAPLALLRNDPGFQPQVFLPLIANTTAVDRSARVLKNVNFVAYAQSAIQTVQINGSVNV